MVRPVHMHAHVPTPPDLAQTAQLPGREDLLA